jgi:hypothetical protein
MFDRMQYIFGVPSVDKRFTTWKCKIFDNDDKILGYVTRQKPSFVHSYSTKVPQVWLEDVNYARLCEIRRDKPIDFADLAIYDQFDVRLGIIEREMSFNRAYWFSGGSFYLLDQKRTQVALSDKVSYVRLGGDLVLGRFEELRDKGLNIYTSEGSTVALVHAAKNSSGCQIDIYPSNISQLLVLNLVASIIFL